jgi:hypothetical protein
MQFFNNFSSKVVVVILTFLFSFILTPVRAQVSPAIEALTLVTPTNAAPVAVSVKTVTKAKSVSKVIWIRSVRYRTINGKRHYGLRARAYMQARNGRLRSLPRKSFWVKGKEPIFIDVELTKPDQIGTGFSTARNQRTQSTPTPPPTPEPTPEPTVIVGQNSTNPSISFEVIRVVIIIIAVMLVVSTAMYDPKSKSIPTQESWVSRKLDSQAKKPLKKEVVEDTGLDIAQKIKYLVERLDNGDGPALIHESQYITGLTKPLPHYASCIPFLRNWYFSVQGISPHALKELLEDHDPMPLAVVMTDGNLTLKDIMPARKKKRLAQAGTSLLFRKEGENQPIVTHLVVWQ